METKLKMNKLLALGFSALLCCALADALQCVVCQKKVPVFGCVKGRGVCSPTRGLPCKHIRVYTSVFNTDREGSMAFSQATCAVQGDRCNIMEPAKTGHYQISCCNTNFCNN